METYNIPPVSYLSCSLDLQTSSVSQTEKYPQRKREFQNMPEAEKENCTGN
jgi:hypothetical protein